MKKILLVLISSFLLGGCNRLDSHQPLTSSRLSYEFNDSIGQSFVSNENNLNIVSICIRNPSRVLTPFELSLHEATSSATPVRVVAFSGGNIDNQDCTRFQFDPISDSENKTYLAQITAKPKTLTRDYYNVYVEAHQGGDYKNGEAYLGVTKTDLDLHFKTLYKQDLKIVISESLNQFASRIMQDPVFILLYAALLFVVIYRMLK